MQILFSLYLTFARIGVSTFGGGYAMLPVLRREIVQKRRWITDAELTDCYAMSQCLPGLIAVNFATYAGYRQRGVLGGIMATLGVISPSVVIVTLIAAFVGHFSELEVVKNAFAGVRVCVCVLILDSIVGLWKNAVVNRRSLVIFLVVFSCAAFTRLSAAVLVIAAGLVGILGSRRETAG
ncbi:chromate transporter [Sporobacter termitidis DSM 10068]|uniref:Chromate transporter n=1 Tax=Sporobacter termitidis DSM 10068 TaxID=1123282 RepID=A0A1M5XD70_9FIRM|nr:chromate transporter [Sporobacter termitidis]SHH97770.1 chromate transporter [Sporobacter termitidis DSM 10068]